MRTRAVQDANAYRHCSATAADSLLVGGGGLTEGQPPFPRVRTSPITSYDQLLCGTGGYMLAPGLTNILCLIYPWLHGPAVEVYRCGPSQLNRYAPPSASHSYPACHDRLVPSISNRTSPSIPCHYPGRDLDSKSWTEKEGTTSISVEISPVTERGYMNHGLLPGHGPRIPPCSWLKAARVSHFWQKIKYPTHNSPGLVPRAC